MKPLAVTALAFVAGLALMFSISGKGTPQPFAAAYDYGITPNGQTGFYPDGTPCFTEDNEWQRGWTGDLAGTFVTSPLVFCPWGNAGLYVTVSVPRGASISLSATDGYGTTFVAHDLGVIGKRHVYSHCFFHPGNANYTFYTANRDAAGNYIPAPWAVTLAGMSRDVSLTVWVIPDYSGSISRSSFCPQQDWTAF